MMQYYILNLSIEQYWDFENEQWCDDKHLSDWDNCKRTVVIHELSNCSIIRET